MILFDPSLSVSAGFLLSVFSTLGIILFGGVGARKVVPSVSDPLTGKTGREVASFFVAFWDDFRTTLSAQAGTLPILFVFFGQYNVLSLIVNGLILFTIPPLMILGSLAAALGFVYRPLAGVILYLSLPLLVYIEFVVEQFARIPIYLIFGGVSLFLVIGYYFIFFAIYLLFRSKRS
jgi:predicted membrane metal-binding protein